MHRLAILFVIIVCGSLTHVSMAQDAGTTTWYIVRHADRAGQKDQLTEAGEQRAEVLAGLMKTLRVSAVYSTATQRTQLTAKPTADALGLEVTTYGRLSPEWFKKMASEHQGETVLIVAHSNTSGQVVKGLGGEGDFSIEEDKFDNLFIVTTSESGTQAIRIKFGQ